MEVGALEAAAKPLHLSIAASGATIGMFLTDDANRGQFAVAAPGHGLDVALGASLPAAIADALRLIKPTVLLLSVAEDLEVVPWEQASDGERTIGTKFAVSRVVDAEGPRSPADSARARKPSASLVVVSDDGARAQGAGADVVLLAHRRPTQLLRARIDEAVKAGARLVVVSTDRSVESRIIRHCVRSSSTALLVHLCDDESVSTDPWLGEALQALRSGATVAQAARAARLRLAAVSGPEAEIVVYGGVDQPLVTAPIELLVDSHRQVTVLAYDLVESTRLMLQVGDERYSQLVTAFHERCGTIVRHYGGAADRHLGDDGVLCYFGFPRAQEGSTLRAVRAGLELVHAVAEFGLAMRIGVATGPVAVKDGQPYGRPLALAARLAKSAQPGQVVIETTTHARISDAFETTALDSDEELKGIPGTTCRWRVDGHSADDASSTRNSARLTAFLGRQSEFSGLLEHWAQVQVTGSGRVVLVNGEAGIGKSRLLREFRVSIQSSGANVVQAHGRDDSATSAFGTLTDTMRRIVGLLPADDFPAVREKLMRAAPAPLQDDPSSIDQLTALLAYTWNPGVRDDDAHGWRVRTLTALSAWFEASARSAALCLIVDDVQWADPSTLELLASLSGLAVGLPLLIVFAARDETGERWRRLRTDATIRLQGVPLAAAREIVRQACSGVPLDEPVLRTLTDKGDGIPLFLEQSAHMARDLRSRGVGGGTPALQVPGTIHDVLMTRLDLLGPAKTLAQLCSVLGREFPAALLLSVLDAIGAGLRIDDPPLQLATLEAAGLLLRREGHLGRRFRFRHALIQDVAHGSIWEKDRIEIHRTVADVLQRSFPHLSHQQPELLAHHLTEAGRYAEALDAWEAAGRLAASRSAGLEALNHAEHALATLLHMPAGADRDRRELRLAMLLASRVIAIEGYGADRVEHLYLRAASLCDDSTDRTVRIRIDLGLESHYFMRADFDRAEEVANRAVQATTSAPHSHHHLQALWATGNIAIHRGDMQRGIDIMDRCLAVWRPELHRRAAVQDPAVMCLCYSAWSLWERGDADEALERIRRVLQLADTLDHRFSQAEAHSFAASIRLFRGELDDALAHADAAITLCEENGFAVWLAHSRLMRGKVRATCGDVAAGLEEMQHAYRSWERSGAVVTRPFYLALQAETLLDAGDVDAALTVVREARAMAEANGERYHLAELLRIEAEALVAGGREDSRVAGARTLLEKALTVARAQGKASFVLRAAIAWSEMPGALPERARAELEAALAGAAGSRGTRDHRNGERALARVVQSEEPLVAVLP